MEFYLIIALTSAVLTRGATYFARNSKMLSLLFYGLVVILLCHFAGIRDLSVGSDTSGYGYYSYYFAKMYTFDFFFNEGPYSNWGPLFKILCWTVSNISHSLYWYFFFIQLITILPILQSCHRASERFLPLAVFCYVLMFYPMSFNMMRQMVSMSMLTYAYSYASDSRPYHFVLIVLMAMGFHVSAALGLLIYPICQLVKLRGISNGLKLLLLCSGSLTIIALAPSAFSLLGNAGLYEEYVSGDAVSGGGLRTLLITFGTVAAIGLLAASFLRDAPRDRIDDILSLFSIVIFGVFCLSLSLVSMWLYRIGMYFIYFILLLLPVMCDSVPDRGSRLVTLVACLFLVSIWSLDYYVVVGSHSIIPYIVTSIPL